MRADPPYRSAFLGLAILSAVAALYPQIALAPLAPYLERSRAPDSAARAAVWLLWSSAVLSVGVFAARRRLHSGAIAVSKVIARLPRVWFWALALALASLPRLLTAVLLPRQAIADALWYHLTASSLAAGEGLAIDGEPTAYRFPGYPFLLSLTYRLFGPEPRLAWAWGALSTLVMLWAVHRLATTLHGETAGRLATLGLAVYPATALLTAEPMSDLPFAAGVLVLGVLLLRPGSERPLAAMPIGLLLAFLTLTRGAALGLVGVAAGVWGLRRVGLSRIIRAVLVVFVTTALAVAPWLLRNRAAVGGAVLSTNFGLNLAIGNHPGASGGYGPAPWPEGAELEGLSPAGVDALLLRRAGSYVLDQPLEFLALLPNKLFHLYALETSAVTAAFHGNEGLPPALKYAAYGVCQFAYLLVVLLFARRLVDLLGKQHLPHGLQWSSWLMIGYFTLAALAFFGQDRYRLPILPWMLIEGSVVAARSLGRTPSPDAGPDSEPEPA